MSTPSGGHHQPHFADDGLCRCGCDDCTLRVAGGCICVDCPCENNDEHRARRVAAGMSDDEPQITAHFVRAYLPVSEEALMDIGLIPDTRPPMRTPWHWRLRWHWQSWRERVGRKVGGWIAGVDLSDSD